MDAPFFRMGGDARALNEDEICREKIILDTVNKLDKLGEIQWKENL